MVIAEVFFPKCNGFDIAENGLIATICYGEITTI